MLTHPASKKIKRIMLIGALEDRMAFTDEVEAHFKTTDIKVDYPANILVINHKKKSCTYILLHLYGYESHYLNEKLKFEENEFWDEVSNSLPYKDIILSMNLLIFINAKKKIRDYFKPYLARENIVAIDYDKNKMSAIDCLGSIDKLTSLKKSFKTEEDQAFDKFRLVISAFYFDEFSSISCLLIELIPKLMWPLVSRQYMNGQHVFFKLPTLDKFLEMNDAEKLPSENNQECKPAFMNR